jgi:hypothetical protein
MTRIMACALALLVATLSGCVITPESETRIANRTDAVFFHGYAKLGSSDIVLKAMNWQTNQMEEIGRTKTQSTPGIQENTWGTHPALYYWSITVPVASAATQNARWKLKSCDDTPTHPVPGKVGSISPASCLLTYEAELVVSQPADNGFELWTLPQGGGQCLVDKIQQPNAELFDSFIGCSTRGAQLTLLASH